MQKGTKPSKLARNLIKKHGLEKFNYLIDSFQKGVAMPQIAQEFQVTRQRVQQWRQALGNHYSHFTPHPEIRTLLSESDSNNSRIVI